MEVYMQIYIMPDGSKRQFEVAPEGARPLKPEKKVEKVEEKAEQPAENKAVKETKNKAVTKSKTKRTKAE
jgi:hypothetical protein